MTGSAIYEGWVAHRRFGSVPHSFRYRVFMPLFDLDELPGVLDPIPLWSARRPAPARFREADHLRVGEGPLAMRARVARVTGAPNTRTAPCHGRTSPSRALNNVVLPEPVGPTNPASWPAWKVNVTSRKTGWR